MRLITKKRFITFLFISFAIVIIVGIAIPSFGADSVDILTSTKDSMAANSAWWTSLWELNYKNTTTFSDTPSLSNMVLAQITQWFFVVALIIYILMLIMKICFLIDRGPLEILKEVYPFILSVILVVTLMANNSANLKGILFKNEQGQFQDIDGLLSFLMPILLIQRLGKR